MTRDEIIQRVHHLDQEQLLALLRLLDQLEARPENQKPVTEQDLGDPGDVK